MIRGCKERSAFILWTECSVFLYETHFMHDCFIATFYNTFLFGDVKISRFTCHSLLTKMLSLEFRSRTQHQEEMTISFTILS